MSSKTLNKADASVIYCTIRAGSICGNPEPRPDCLEHIPVVSASLIGQEQLWPVSRELTGTSERPDPDALVLTHHSGFNMRGIEFWV